jgi:hypothetical protein
MPAIAGRDRTLHYIARPMDFARKHLIAIDEKLFPASTKLQNRKSYICEAHQ